MTESIINRQPLPTYDLNGKPFVLTMDYGLIIKCLERMCENTRHLQNIKVNGIDQLIFTHNYYREFCTVIVGGGRQTGKTAWVIDQCLEGNLILVENAFMAQDILDRIKRIRTSEDAPAPGWVLSMQDFEAMIARGDVKKFKKIIVDDTTFVFSKWNIKKFYKTSKLFCLDDTMYYLIG